MSEPQNLANAAVIITAVYFMFQTGFNWWMLALIAFGIITWGISHQTKETKELIKLEIQQREANIKNLNAATAIAIANVKIIAGKLGQ